MVNCCGTKKELRIVMLGVQGCGKTSIIKAISGEIMGDPDYQNSIPTYGFDIKNILFEDQVLNIWDIGGSEE
jgi:ADP-ribosylation factor-like protein 2